MFDFSVIIGAVVALGIGYLVGSIPFSLLVSRTFGIGDIRNMGSKNVGATNVMRNSNFGIGMVALSLDLLKGVAAFKLSQHFQLTQPFATEAGIMSVIGHIFPIWLGFVGGKGVATMVGTLFCFSIHLGLAFVMSWSLVFYLFKYSSLASVIALITVSVTSLISDPIHLSIEVLFMSSFILYKHKDNMRRFLDGQEKQLDLFSKTKNAS